MVVVVAFSSPLFAEDENEEFYETYQVLDSGPVDEQFRRAQIDAGLAKLSDPNAWRRQSGIHLLASWGSSEYAKAVAPLLDDSDPGVRCSAINALLRLGGQPYVSQIGARLNDSGEYSDEFGGRYPVKGCAARALGRLKAQEYTDTIASLSSDDAAFVRENAIFALGELQAVQYAERVAGYLNDPVPWVRGEAVSTLVKLQVRDRVSEIAGLLRDDDDGVRYKAVKALAQLGGMEHVRDIASLLDEPRPHRTDPGFLKHGEQVKGMAVQALGRLGAKEYERKIAKLLRYKDHFVADSAAKVLSDWGLAKKYGIVRNPFSNPFELRNP